MSNDGFEQLSAVVGLSQQKDGLALTQAMIRSLGEMSPGSDVAVLEVYGRRSLADVADLTDFSKISIRRFDVTGQRVNNEDGCRDDLLDVIRRLQPVETACEHDAGGRIIIPLWGDIGPLRLVSMRGVNADPWVRAKVMQVVEIYGNLIRMMDSRERDALTGLLNRQTFAALFELAKNRVDMSAGQFLALAILDIDHFKRINDTYGHLFGDEVLIHFSRLMERSFRYTDDLFRFGGEEFVVLLATDSADSARRAFDRFRNRVQEYDFPGVGAVTVSIGYVPCSGSTLPTTLVDQADRALYHAKENGRNRVVDFADLQDQADSQSGAIDLF
jgi:diguanylate cyclase (GGDEF)-like protein